MTRRKKFGIVLVASPLLAGVVAWLGILWINYQAKQAWEDYRTEMETQGVSFDWKDTIPDRVPDEENFALAPILQDEAVLSALDPIQRPDWKRTRSYLGWRASQHYPFEEFYQPEDGDAIAALRAHYQQHESSLLALVEASKLPHCREPMDYNNINAITGGLPSKLRSISKALNTTAAFRLTQNESAVALTLVLANLRVAKHAPSRSFISHLVRLTNYALGISSIWEGLARRAWNEDQLADLESHLQGIDLHSDFVDTIKDERAIAIRNYELMIENPRLMANTLKAMSPILGSDMLCLSIAIRFAPEAVIYRNGITDAKLKSRWIEIANHPKFLSEISAFFDEWMVRKSAFFGQTHPYEAVALAGNGPFLRKCLESTIQAQTAIDLARVAIALERYRLAEGHYPGTLNALVPDWLPVVPLDRIDQRPLRYKIKEDGTIQVYSIAWNAKDDKAAIFKDYDQGDEVWQYTNPKLSTE